MTADTLKKIAILSVLYFIFGKLAFVFSLSFGTITSSIFFPEGIALAFVLLYGIRVSPGVFIGQLALASMSELSLFSSILISLANMVEMILGYQILKSLGFNLSLESIKDYLLLVATIALVLQPFSAGIGCFSMFLFNDLSTNDFFNALKYWWVGNMMAQLLLTPTLLALANYVTKKNIVALLSISLVMGLLYYLLLDFLSRQWGMHPIHLFSVIFTLIIAIAVKYNFVGATISNLILAIIVQGMTVKGIGPFTMEDIQERLVYLNTFIVGIALSSTLVGIALKELKLLNIRYSLILNSAGEGIYGLDVNGKTTFTNLAAEKMLGYAEEELLGKPQHAIIHHSKPDGSPYPIKDCPIYAAFNDGKVHRETDEVFWRKDRTCFPVDYVSTPILENEKLTGAVITFQDITQRKQAEEKIKSYYSELEKVNEELQSFSSIASHDLQEPLRKIIIFGDRLATRVAETDEQSRNYLDRMQKSALRMRSLVEDLLQYTRLESKARSFETLDVNVVIENVLDDLSTNYRYAGGCK